MTARDPGHGYEYGYGYGREPGRGRPEVLATLCVLVLSIFLVPASIAAQAAPSAPAELVVGYLEGEVTVRATADTPGVGTVLLGTEILDLGPDGYVEIRTGGGTLRLAGPGEFFLAETVPVLPGDSPRRNIATALSGRMRRITGEQEQREAVVAGVRGDFGGAAEASGLWPSAAGSIGDLSGELHAAALAAARSGQTEEAEELLEEALLYATPGSEGAIRLDLAALLLHREQYDAVLDIVRESRYDATAPEEQVQLELLAAEAAMLTDNREETILSLQAVQNLAPQSAWAVAARRMLAELDLDP